MQLQFTFNCPVCGDSAVSLELHEGAGTRRTCYSCDDQTHPGILQPIAISEVDSDKEEVGTEFVLTRRQALNVVLGLANSTADQDNVLHTSAVALVQAMANSTSMPWE